MSSTEDFARRSRLVARWLELTRDILPAMATTSGWPISLDHCFMRVCLDMAVGTPWTAHIRRPAIAHMSERQLEAAIEVAEHVAGCPDVLRGLNARSLAGRRAAPSRPYHKV